MRTSSTKLPSRSARGAKIPMPRFAPSSRRPFAKTTADLTPLRGVTEALVRDECLVGPLLGSVASLSRPAVPRRGEEPFAPFVERLRHRGRVGEDMPIMLLPTRDHEAARVEKAVTRLARFAGIVGKHLSVEVVQDLCELLREAGDHGLVELGERGDQRLERGVLVAVTELAAVEQCNQRPEPRAIHARAIARVRGASPLKRLALFATSFTASRFTSFGSLFWATPSRPPHSRPALVSLAARARRPRENRTASSSVSSRLRRG